MVGREFAYEIMLDEVASTSGTGLTPVDGWRELANAYEIEEKSSSGERVWLDWDIVVTQPWNDGRLADALRNLSHGPAGKYGKWRFDPSNHFITLWLPMRLAEVRNGMHSIGAGMLSNTGTVPARAIFDLSPLYRRLTQPVAWENRSEHGVFRTKDGGPGGVNVGDWRLGATI
jgi:hypothetical protein